MSNLIQSARLFFHRRALREALKARKSAQRLRKTISFEESKHIGLLFDATELGHREIIQRYAESLAKQGKKVKLLGFFDHKQDGEGFAFPFYHQQHVNWALCPSGEAVSEFLAEPLDILIYAHPVLHTHMAYIAALSQASLKAGPFSQDADCFDLMIDMGSTGDLRQLLREVEFFLKKTNAKQHESAAV